MTSGIREVAFASECADLATRGGQWPEFGDDSQVVHALRWDAATALDRGRAG